MFTHTSKNPMRFETLTAALAVLGLVALVTGCTQDQDASAHADDLPDAPTAESAQSPAGRVGSHGMVVAGEPGHAFLSHIPTFGPPHDVQLVVAGAMIAAAGRALPATLSDRSYTFLPERTSLDALRNGVTRELRGTLYLGNFEQGGRPVASGVRFAVDHVVHQHLLVPTPNVTDAGTDAGTDASTGPTYVVFGTRAHAFAVHYIAAAPSFDEVLTVKLGSDAPSDADLARGVIAHASSRLVVSDGAARTLTTETQTFGVTASRSLSCLDGPDFFAPCE
jgi:hypothetical protein